MFLAKNTPYETLEFNESDLIEINLDSLILALTTALEVDFTSQEISINIQELFNSLNFSQPSNLIKKIKESIIFLNNEGYLRQEDGKYSISRTGRHYGARALQNFREFTANYA